MWGSCRRSMVIVMSNGAKTKKLVIVYCVIFDLVGLLSLWLVIEKVGR